MTIEFSTDFKKAWKHRIAPFPKIVVRAEERIALFISNPRHSLLKNHALAGRKIQLRAFSITGDIRIVYAPFSKTNVRLLDIGTHNQVY